MEIVEVKLPCGKILKIKLENGVNLIEHDDTVFMLIDGKKINDKAST